MNRSINKTNSWATGSAWIAGFCIVLTAAPAPCADKAGSPNQRVDFSRDIRPILADKCFSCHGPDAASRKAKLRLDTREGLLRKDEPVIEPGKSAASELYRRVSAIEPTEMMPPPKARKPLTAEQINLLRRWIDEGAASSKHWAFEAPVRRPLPELRKAGSSVRYRNPIDAFLMARLREQGLQPTAEADRETLIRRVAFALTGLPPTVKETDQFLADKAPGAYERLVDRYLSSSRFGEEMARHWLDVARYADTHGLHLDNERTMWAYRDWVIRAFNANLPFDQFTIWQVAGDQLPEPTPDEIIATGFNRCNVTSGEGGSINAEFLYRYAVERTSTVAETWLGLTAGCAVCHDHKYDPISQKEFYSLYAFFYSAADPAMDGNINATAPFQKLPSHAQESAQEAAAKAEKDALERLEKAAAKAVYMDPAEIKPTPAKHAVADVLFDDAFPPATQENNTSRNPADWVTDPPFGAASGRRVLRQASSYFHQDVIQPQLKPFIVPAEGRISVWVRLDPVQPPRAIAIKVTGARRLWWGKPDQDDNPVADGAPRGPLPEAGRWIELNLPAADFGLKPGQRVANLALQQVGGIVYWDAFAIHGVTDPATDPLESLNVWWKSLKGKKAPPGTPAELQAALKDGPDKKHSPEIVRKLQDFYLARIARPVTGEVANCRKSWEDARAAKQIADAAIEGTMVFRDMDKPRDAFVMIRGQYDKAGEGVQPGAPSILPPLKTAKPGARPSRLDLARWLVTPENPLTPRVEVNRLWQQFFGIGLVKTSFDFGTQGELPSHPELLDWLASEFRDSGWDVKQMVRLLVTSEAFKREARLTPELQRRDPENRLLARGPRFRLDAEQVRDNALFVSGLLNQTMGGRGVKTYQPPNIWEPVGYGDSNTRYYMQDHGSALYRRSIYVFFKRTAPPPFMINFDAPNREQFCAVRGRTNTPLQALELMNDVQQFEAARALAERTLAEAGPTPAERIAFLYRTVLSRRPDQEETALVAEAAAKQLALFRARPAAAAKAIHVGESPVKSKAPAPELSAWTMIANLILNLDETLNRN